LNILDYLYESYHGNHPDDSQGFAEKLASNCDVLLRYNATLTPLRFTYLLAPQIAGIAAPAEGTGDQPVVTDPRREWLSQVDAKVKDQLGVKQDNYAGLMYHTDTTALTLFALVDWIQLESLGAFIDGKDTYIKYSSDPRKEGLSRPLEHIFAAEQRVAVHDENQPGKPIVLVKPRVTALFDEYRRVERFLKAWVLGFVDQTVYTPRDDQGSAGHLMQVVVPPEPGELGPLRNPITEPHKYWLNSPHDFENDNVPFIIGAETACLRSLAFSAQKEIPEMHTRLEKAIQQKLMDLYTNQYSAQWAKGEGDAIGVNLERAYRATKSEDTLDKLLYVVLMCQYTEKHKKLEEYSAKYGTGANLKDEYAKAAREYEIKLVSIFKRILEQQISTLASLNP
jgi:hypothetical protein